MSKSSGLKSNAFHESERIFQKLSHSDFSIDAKFDTMSDNNDLIDYLMSKEDWEKFFVRKKSGACDVDTQTANKIFYTCYMIFKDRSDSVDIFSILTDFYKIEPSVFYWKLVKRCRMILMRDLTERTNVDISFKFKQKENGPGQSSFETHLKNNKLE